ncbi:MFS transporter [Chromobacterium paludis]|uniref:MFS transporter n=1 Tax=Chromobacterium paludis TaxID=2605945 RepID=A0A5C1DC24_9NEIS|nr:MFS transporter [Chromobacterium paludis]QEL54196.1 MFS transporter [Chromobacterium paludis]
MELGKWLDERPLGGFQYRLLILCGLCMILDGFDVQAMGYVAPALLEDWGIAKSALGPVFGAGLLGLMLGALLFGALADRIGRRPILLACTLLFSAGMLATAGAATLPQLIALRFFTGVGLGGIMPNAMALAGEYSPARRRASLMMLISCGFTAGALLGGLLAAWLIPVHGWRAVFLVGGVAPLLLWLPMLRGLPESAKFLLLRGKSEQAAFWLRRMEPSLSAGAAFFLAERPSLSNPVAELFRNGLARRTLLLWLLSFLNLIVLYFLSNWMPSLLRAQGLDMRHALLAGSMLQLGGVVGTLSFGHWIDRVGYRKVLLSCFLLAALGLWALGGVRGEALWLYALLFCAGFCIIGVQPAVNALAASAYPTGLRATGVGWSLGVGRVGSVLGPWLGGVLIGLAWSQAALFALLALVTLGSAAVVWAYHREPARRPAGEAA